MLFLYIGIQTDYDVLSVQHARGYHIAMGSRDDQRFPGCARRWFLQLDANDEFPVFDFHVHRLAFHYWFVNVLTV